MPDSVPRFRVVISLDNGSDIPGLPQECFETEEDSEAFDVEIVRMMSDRIMRLDTEAGSVFVPTDKIAFVGIEREDFSG